MFVLLFGFSDVCLLLGLVSGVVASWFWFWVVDRY